jgi:hypothetical protein
MDTKDKSKLNKKIEEILNRFMGEMNDEITRDKIGYEIKIFLENERIKWETLNLHTPTDKIDNGLIDICIDDEYYPFNEIEKITDKNWHEYCFKWETGSLNMKDTIILFQYLIDEGHAWGLQGFYGRTAEELIQEGYCTLSYKETTGHYIWGKPKIPTKFDLKPNAPGTDAYVQKRKELSDDEFFEWSNLQIYEEDEE